MTRWELGARERLRVAALELFTERGYDGVTAAEIAARAGLTERTFFRHFADKPEVLFTGSEQYQAGFTDAIRAAPSAAPLVLVEAALAGGAAFFTPERRRWSRARQAVIDADDRLRERELLKGAALATAVEEALAERGLDAVAASVAARVVAAVHALAFAQWIAVGEIRSIGELDRVLLGRFREMLG